MTPSRISLPAWTLATLLWLLVAGCQERSSDLPPVVDTTLAGKVSARASATPAGLPETSIYHLEGEWEDQDGQTTTLAELQGRPQVIALIYGRCEGACPRIIADIKSVEAAVAKAHPQGIGYLLVTMDPEVDNQERLSALAKEYDLGDAWRLLRGTPDQVRELAAVLGVKYRKVSETDFAHSNTITVLDARGTVVHQKQELGTGVEDSAKAVNTLLAEPSPCCAE